MITIVTNCWAVRCPQYAVFLRAQLSSLVIHKPCVPVQFIPIYDDEDARTRRVISDFQTEITMVPIALPERHNWRRAIGRNAATRHIHPDCELVWFTDCDYLFGEGCLDAIYAAWEHHKRPEMIWPTTCLANADKKFVDDYVQTTLDLEKTSVVGRFCSPWNRTHFVPTQFPRAIGGLQCVSADYARVYGYLPDSKWQKPPDVPFQSFADDVKFRKMLQARGRCVGIDDLPNFYRLRHTEVGYPTGDGNGTESKSA